MTRADLASGLRWRMAVLLTLKNADAQPGKHWDLSTNSYGDNPVEEGKHWDYDTYKMVAD